MKKLFGPYSDFLFAVLRIVAALMFLSHGLQKFNIAMLGGFQPPFFALTAAGWIETIGGTPDHRRAGHDGTSRSC